MLCHSVPGGSFSRTELRRMDLNYQLNEAIPGADQRNFTGDMGPGYYKNLPQMPTSIYAIGVQAGM